MSESVMDENYRIISMGDLKLSRIGTITFTEDDNIHVEGFEAEGASCREVCILALMWAKEQGLDIPNLDAEIEANLAMPGGTGNVGVD